MLAVPSQHVVDYASTPRFLAQLSEASRLRDATLVGSPSHAPLPEALEGPEWHSAIQTLSRTLAAGLKLNCPLERLHGALDHFSPNPAAHSRVSKLKSALLEPLADPAAAADFLSAYDALICDVVAPHVAQRSDVDVDGLWYAAFPTLRVQTPSVCARIDDSPIPPNANSPSAMPPLTHLPLGHHIAAFADWSRDYSPAL